MSETLRMPTVGPRFAASLEMLRRVGATQIQVRYQDDEQPVVWLLVAGWKDDLFEVGAGLDPLDAATRLLERVVDGAACTHCGRRTGLQGETLDAMPFDDLICWYQYDPEMETYRRGCEGDAP